MSAAHGRQAPLKEGQAGPPDHRRRQGELTPGVHRRGDRQVQAQMPAHLDHQQRQAQDQADPEAAGEVGDLRIGLLVRRNGLRFQGHATDGTGAGARPADLGMHRAGIGRPRRRRRLGRAGVQVLGRIALELGPAAAAAEEMCRSGVFQAGFAGLTVDAHAADGIDGRVSVDNSDAVIVAVVVVMVAHELASIPPWGMLQLPRRGI